MAQYTIKQFNKVEVGEIPLIDQIDGDDLLIKPSGVFFKKNGEVTGIFSKVDCIDFLGFSNNTVSRNTADLTIPGSTGSVIVNLDIGSPVAITSIDIAPRPAIGTKLLVAIVNASDADRTIAVKGSAEAYFAPEAKTSMSLIAGHTGLITFFLRNDGFYVTFKGGFN